MNLIKKAWFTLVELMVALSISALVLLVIFNFITDTIVQLVETNRKSQFLWDFARFTGRMNSHMSTFSNTSILIDQSDTVWQDVLLLKNIEWNAGMVWWVVDASTFKLLPNSKYGKYENAVMWYRLISSAELADITATPTNIYNYSFFWDKTFSDFKVKKFQTEYFNGTDILSIDLSIETTYEPELLWIDWSTLPTENLFEVNINF